MAERKKITIVGAGNVGATAAHCFFFAPSAAAVQMAESILLILRLIRQNLWARVLDGFRAAYLLPRS